MNLSIVLALLVALIGASAGLAQATLGVSGAGVAARQRAVESELALLRAVVDRLADLSADMIRALRARQRPDDEVAARLDAMAQRASAAVQMAGPEYRGYTPAEDALIVVHRYLTQSGQGEPPSAGAVRTAIDHAIREFGVDVQTRHSRLTALAQGPSTRAIARLRR